MDRRLGDKSCVTDTQQQGGRDSLRPTWSALKRRSLTDTVETDVGTQIPCRRFTVYDQWQNKQGKERVSERERERERERGGGGGGGQLERKIELE